MSDVADLIERTCNGTAGDDDRVALTAILAKDAAARRAFIERMDLHASLQWQCSAIESTSPATEVEAMPIIEAVDTVQPVADNRQWALYSGIAAALIAACGIAAYLIATSVDPQPVEPPRPDVPVATLIGSSDGATVIVNNGIANPGEDYTSGAYSIESGSAQLMLTNAVDIKLRGETRLHVHNNMHATLRRGSAVFTCPPGTEGYTVVLPDRTSIIDLGTSFGIAVSDDGDADVRVLRGEVAWTSTGPLAVSVRITAGQMAKVEGDTIVVGPIPSRIAYAVPAGTVGNQDFGGTIGMDFDVDQPITITHLGAFDSASDGLKRPITVTLYDRDIAEAIATLTINGDEGELIGGTRFVAFDEPIRLPADFAGTIAASGYGPDERLGNDPITAKAWTTDDGDGAIRFVGDGRYGNAPDAFAPIVDNGPADRYAAGSFRFLAYQISDTDRVRSATTETESEQPRSLERSSK